MSFHQFLPKLKGLPRKPVLVLIAIHILVGLFTFRDYGFSIDEPLFYGYADALGYAYSPKEWLSGDFQLERAFGPSPWDHANRGPAYLLLARGPARLLRSLGLDLASSWHIVNFLAFQFGIYFFYVLCRRWMQPWAAITATALFSTQPVLWEHAFINPKDPPFLVLFIIALEFGFRMADQLAAAGPDRPPFVQLRYTILPAILLGLTTSVRILGPLAGALIILYFLSLGKPRKLIWFVPYGLIAVLTMVLTWPLLWEGPVTRFIETLTFMSDNPTQLRVLFYGRLYRADDLPLRYLPVMFFYTLTEPLWPLAAIGAVVAFARWRKEDLDWKSLLPTLLWFMLPFAYVLWKRPPMYDGFRHFMFILPPAFVLAGLALDAFFRRIKVAALRILAIAVLLAPGILAAIQLHPYEYTYYNSFAGGTDQASYQFETDYWLTCYKDAVQSFNPGAWQSHRLFVKREGYIASYYAREDIQIIDISISRENPRPGDYVLENSRANDTMQKYRDQHEFTRVIRDHAVFCVIEKRTAK